MSRRGSSAVSEAIVGIFMIVVIALLGYFTIVISGVDLLRGDKKTTVRVAFNHVGGLKAHDNVLYRGTKVGTVDDVEVTPSNLIVTASVDDRIVLRSSCRAAVCNLSMLGGNYLLLEEGEGEVRKLGADVLNGEEPTDWLRDVSLVAKNMRELTELKEIRSIVTNVEAATQKAKLLIDKTNVAVDKTTAFMEQAREAAATINGVADKADVIVSGVQRGEGTVGRLLSTNDTVYVDLQKTVANAREITAKLNKDKTFADLEAGVAAFRQAAESVDAREVMTKAETLLDNLNAVAANLKEGKGTLGRLAQDPEMYNEVNALIKDVRQVIDNYRDTTPISTFSSLAVGAF